MREGRGGGRLPGRPAYPVSHIPSVAAASETRQAHGSVTRSVAVEVSKSVDLVSMSGRAVRKGYGPMLEEASGPPKPCGVSAGARGRPG